VCEGLLYNCYICVINLTSSYIYFYNFVRHYIYIYIYIYGSTRLTVPKFETPRPKGEKSNGPRIFPNCYESLFGLSKSKQKKM